MLSGMRSLRWLDARLHPKQTNRQTPAAHATSRELVKECRAAPDQLAQLVSMVQWCSTSAGAASAWIGLGCYGAAVAAGR